MKRFFRRPNSDDKQKTQLSLGLLNQASSSAVGSQTHAVDSSHTVAPFVQDKSHNEPAHEQCTRAQSVLTNSFPRESTSHVDSSSLASSTSTARELHRLPLEVINPRPPIPQTAKLALHDTTTAEARSQYFDAVERPSASATVTSARLVVPQALDTPPPSIESRHGIARTNVRMPRRIWVKRSNAPATAIRIQDDDLVDDVKDKILHKYANSLGRSFDSPDVVLRVVAKPDALRPGPDRLLSPEEVIARILDSYYPGGQTIDEALIIDILPKRTPKLSPRPSQLYTSIHGSYSAVESSRPEETGTDYFPPMPAPVQLPTNQANEARILQPHMLTMPEHNRSISVLHAGQVPALPSPGAARRHRPKYQRQNTSSPTTVSHSSSSLAGAVNASAGNATHHLLHRNLHRPRLDSHTSERPGLAMPTAPPLPTPPATETSSIAKPGSTPPTPLARDHAHRIPRARKNKRVTPTNGTPLVKLGANPAVPLDNSVPPINVLIVEDNIINLKVLEAFMKRLRVRWSTAMNGQIAVNKWRAGGFHLVLMDIQLPIMNGLEATKEIRGLERVNGIGVFSNSSPPTPLAKTRTKSADGVEGTNIDMTQADDGPSDTLAKDDGLFKSPVIIVALTASSLQSDRHEALAAGCNDFLTKVGLACKQTQQALTMSSQSASHG